MDKASIIQDAIAYIEALQEQELQAENDASVGSQAEEEGVGLPRRKKMRRTSSASSINDAITSPATYPVQIIEVIIHLLLTPD